MLIFKKEQVMARMEKTFWQGVGKIIVVLALVAMPAPLFALPSLPQGDQLEWFNGSQAVYWTLNSNGTLKNRTVTDGWNWVSTQVLASGWSLATSHANGDKLGNDQLLWQNTVTGTSVWWKLNSNGTLKNRTQQNGWDWISTQTLGTSWRMTHLQANADKAGNAHLLWWNASTQKAVYWKLNSNGSLKNRTIGDGWNYVATQTAGDGWYPSQVQANADSLNSDHLVWHSTVNGKSSYWKLNSNGTLKNRTVTDGWNWIGTWTMATTWRMADLQTNSSKAAGAGINHIIWNDSSSNKAVYWTLNSNGTLKNRTVTDGWNWIATHTLDSGWSIDRLQRNADSLNNDNIIWHNSVSGKTAYWKLNSNGTLKNRTTSDGWGYISTHVLTTGWRIRALVYYHAPVS